MDPNVEVLLGIDGGGTSTTLATADLTGGVRGRCQVAGSSLSRRPAAEVAQVLASGVEQLGLRPADVNAVCAGFASAADPGRQGSYRTLLQTLLPHARVQVLTDAELAWYGAAGGADALVVIAGTGSIAWGRHHGQQRRVGGAGPGHDAGSGDWIGRQAVAAGLVAAPGDGGYAALLPALARNPASGAVFQQAGQELAQLAATCARELEWEDPDIYLWGGVLEHVAPVRDAFIHACRWPVRNLLRPPVEAALELARTALELP